MKKTLILLGAMLAGAAASQAQVNIPYTEIPYEVHYHWGLIDLNIATGRVTMSTDGQQFNATLDGSSIPWEGRIFCISDQLQATMTPTSGLSHETVTYENGWYRKPLVSEYRSGTYDANNPANYKNIKGEGDLNADGSTMEAVTVTADMLGMFYYFREIDFESMAPGSSITIPITVEGGYDQSVVVTYNGKSSYSVGGNTFPTYSTSFEYSYRGAMSGYPVQAQVSVSNRIPLLLSANLPVGHIEMIHNPY
ncbi:MAG: DUF3108 domain-containing protein [Muribaculaceae bacterium]|nr:DUF3108 domain-containing protein [Muribaculaceae bacterium]